LEPHGVAGFLNLHGVVMADVGFARFEVHQQH
jgi:hypothetical protein